MNAGLRLQPSKPRLPQPIAARPGKGHRPWPGTGNRDGSDCKTAGQV
jgi:hypothetical protein